MSETEAGPWALRARVEKIEARVAALESRGTAAITPEGKAAIARFRDRCERGVWNGVTDSRAVLAALDREKDAKAECYRQLVQVNDDLDARDARLRDLEEQLASYRASFDDAEHTVTQLRAQLAARTDAQPLGWVNMYKDGLYTVHRTESDARAAAKKYQFYYTRIAIPVYEHPPVAAQPWPVVGSVVPEEFELWLKGEMPTGTIIGDAKWWARRIWWRITKLRGPEIQGGAP